MRILRNRTPAKIFSGISLQRRIIIGSTAAVMVPFLIMAVFLYHRLSRELAEQSKEKSIQIAKDLSALLDSTLSKELIIVSAIAADNHISDALYAGDYGAVSKTLESVFSKIGGNYISFFVTDSSGIIRVDLPEGARRGLNISDREYFIKARAGKASVNGPVLSRGPAQSKWTNVPILITTAPITRNGYFLGTISISHDINTIRNLMSGIKLGKTGYPFVVDGNGLVLIHPNPEYVMKVNMYQETGMEDILKKIKQREIGAERYNFRGTDKIAGFAPLYVVEWNVVFTQNREEILKPANETLSWITIIGVCFIIITVFAIIVLSGKISSPVQKFVDILGQFTAHTTEFIIGIGPDRKIMFANPVAEQFTGKSAEELIGSDPIFTNTQNIAPEKIWEKLQTGVPWLGRITHDDPVTGEPVIAIMIIPVKDNKGNISGYLEFGRDITGELIQERRIRQTQKIEAIGTLAGGIAHDFNNILAGMFGYVDLALLSLGNPSVTEKYLRELQKASIRASDLVNQILTFSRHSKSELHTIAPNPIVKEVIKLIRASTPAEIDIETNITSDTPILADPIQIHQVIVNMCTNAVHAIGKNHGSISVDIEDVIVDQKFAENHPGLGIGKHVLFRITDSGSGIASNVIDHIFEPFFTTKENGEGTGLGLSVAHGIIHSLGGIITVYSEIGKGSVFSIYIPAASHATEGENTFNNSLQQGTERIMLIDDEIAITSSLESLLAGIGYKITTFTDSPLALEEFRKHPDSYDLVITDHSMAKLTGIDIANEMKRIRNSIPVILMSGYVHRELEENANRSGIEMILKKPVSMSMLAGVIRKLLDKKG